MIDKRPQRTIISISQNSSEEKRRDVYMYAGDLILTDPSAAADSPTSKEVL